MTTLHAHDITQAPELTARASLAFRIRTALAAGAQTTDQIAETIEAGRDSVKRTLTRLAHKGAVLNLVAGQRGQEARWGLTS